MTMPLILIGLLFQFTLPHGERPKRDMEGWERIQFQFTLPHGERLASALSPVSTGQFQFTLPHGERPEHSAPVAVAGLFQFTLPHGERHSPGRGFGPLWEFQFTLPHGERPPLSSVKTQAQSFNSRSRMGSDIIGHYSLQDSIVSIHAPAWGATHRRRHALLITPFQFTLPHGERPVRPPAPPTCTGFNSRSRMGSDEAATRRSRAGRVSIHAPAWGATRPANIWGCMAEFQFTLPHGERPSMVVSKCLTAEFQFTLPHGERPQTRLIQLIRALVSIHAPAWGATDRPGHCRRSDRRFNSRSRMGSDPHARGEPDQAPRFNSRSRMGSDTDRPDTQTHPPSFNSRSRMGSDPTGPTHRHTHQVSIHAPAWGATSRPDPSVCTARGFNSRSRMGSDL